MVRHGRWCLCLLAALAIHGVARASLADEPAPPAGDAPEAADPAEEAAARYRRGREFYAAKAWEQALAEFNASRKLHATWKATSSAALSLKQLSRYDEGLETFEALLRDFASELSPEVKSEAQRQVVELRGLVGTIDVEDAEPGATITVDGRSRGEFPLLAPLRVPSGSHVVRVFLEGFEPFETRIDVAGGRTERVEGKLRPLARSGHARVAEQGNRALDVFVDGGLVGKTPWEGPLSPGEHVIALRGEGNLGTPPSPVTIVVDRTTTLTFAAEPLEASLRVEPVPSNASVLVDGVTVGQGIWEGRLRRGAHSVDVAAPGFVASTQKISLAKGAREVLRVSLQKDPSSPLWRKPARILLEASGALLLSPTLGGDVAGCAAPCESGVAFGGAAALRASYELGSGLGFGVTLGWLGLRQSVSGRETQVTPVGRSPREAVVVDELVASGLVAGGFVGYSFGEGLPVHVRLGAFGVFGSRSDERSGTFVATDGGRYELGDARVAPSAALFGVEPEVLLGYRLGQRVELLGGLRALFLVSLSKSEWDSTREIRIATDGIGTFPAETLGGAISFVVAPGVGARYSF